VLLQKAVPYLRTRAGAFFSEDRDWALGTGDWGLGTGGLGTGGLGTGHSGLGTGCARDPRCATAPPGLCSRMPYNTVCKQTVPHPT